MMTTYFPEMGEAAPKNAIITTMIGRNGGRAKWKPEHHEQVIALLANLKIRPRSLEQFVTVKGDTKWAAHLTSAAMSKLVRHPEVGNEALLD